MACLVCFVNGCCFLWCGVFVYVCVCNVIVCFRCDIVCDAARFDFVSVCCLCMCVRCVRYICGVCEVFGDVVWYAFGCVSC